MPTASGSSAATRLRNTSSENSSRIGAASISARWRSDSTCSPTWLKATTPPPTVTPGSPREARDERVGRRRPRRPPCRRSRAGRPSGGPSRPAATAASPAARARAATSSSSILASTASQLALRRRRAGLGAEPDEHDRVGRGRAPGGALDRVARPDRLRLRVGEVVARVEQPDDRPAERARPRTRRTHRRRPAPPAGGGPARAASASSTTPPRGAGGPSHQLAAHSLVVRDRREVERLR